MPPPFIFLWMWALPLLMANLARRVAANKEEESMSAQPDAEPEPEPEFEFKFLRSSLGAFRKPEKLREALAMEATAGWQLVEKFDDQRLRLRRPVACRAMDASLGHDPYRSRVAGDAAALARFLFLRIAAGLFLGVGVILAIIHYTKR